MRNFSPAQFGLFHLTILAYKKIKSHKAVATLLVFGNITRCRGPAGSEQMHMPPLLIVVWVSSFCASVAAGDSPVLVGVSAAAVALKPEVYISSRFRHASTRSSAAIDDRLNRIRPRTSSTVTLPRLLQRPKRRESAVIERTTAPIRDGRMR